jgi:NADPH:quinone reductase-like Zn-dependent oxidoreductase
VHAAAGGVGHLAVQIAKARGAYVLGTARPAKHDFVRGLGADEVIDYTAAPFESVARDIDIVLDTIGDEYGPRSLRTLRPGGIVLSLASPAETSLTAKAEALGLRSIFTIVEPDQGGLREITALVEAGALRVHIETTFPLARVADAHRLGESGRTTGKIVLTVAE